MSQFFASVLCIRWPNYWSFSFSISPSNEYSGLISFRMDWWDQTLKSSPTTQFKSINFSALSFLYGPTLTSIHAVKVKVIQLCLTFCNPFGIFQARILKWVAFPFSRGSSQPRDRTHILHCRWILYQLSHMGSPWI